MNVAGCADHFDLRCGWCCYLKLVLNPPAESEPATPWWEAIVQGVRIRNRLSVPARTSTSTDRTCCSKAEPDELRLRTCISYMQINTRQQNGDTARKAQAAMTHAGRNRQRHFGMLISGEHLNACTDFGIVEVCAEQVRPQRDLRLKDKSGCRSFVADGEIDATVVFHQLHGKRGLGKANVVYRHLFPNWQASGEREEGDFRHR